MIFTSVSKLGDHILIWPVASWYYKTHGEKITWLLTKNYSLYNIIKPFLEKQPFTKKVELIDVGTDASNPVHYNIDPKNYGYGDESYINFSFRLPEFSYFPEYYSRFGKLDYDREMNKSMYYPTSDEKHETVSIEVQDPADAMRSIKDKVQSDPEDEPVHFLSLNDPYEKNVAIALNANRLIVGMSSFSIVMDLYNRQMTILARQMHYPYISWFYKDVNKHNFVVMP